MAIKTNTKCDRCEQQLLIESGILFCPTHGSEFEGSPTGAVAESVPAEQPAPMVETEGAVTDTGQTAAPSGFIPELVSILPNGDAVFTVKIPEAAFNGLLAECEPINRKVADWIQERMDTYVYEWLI